MQSCPRRETAIFIVLLITAKHSTLLTFPSAREQINKKCGVAWK
jgi:hypothetical protein